jgi:hypothetical protein
VANTCKFPAPWGSLARQHGTVANLALKLGVSYETLYRWAHGLCEPPDAAQDRLTGLFKAAGLPVPAYRNLRGYYRNRTARHAR